MSSSEAIVSDADCGERVVRFCRVRMGCVREDEAMGGGLAIIDALYACHDKFHVKKRNLTGARTLKHCNLYFRRVPFAHGWE